MRFYSFLFDLLALIRLNEFYRMRVALTSVSFAGLNNLNWSL